MEHKNFLNIILGKSRRRKTTRALEHLEKCRKIFGKRVVVYAQRFSNKELKQMFGNSYILDTEDYLQDIEKYIENSEHGILILKQSENNKVFETLENLKNCYILLDDVTLLYEESWPMIKFLATIGQNECICDITTHVPRGDLPKKVMDLATNVYIVGGYDGDLNLKYLYDNVRDIPYKEEEFDLKLKQGEVGEVFQIKGDFESLY